MTSPTTTLSTVVRRLWQADKALTATGVLMLTVFAAALAGLWLDPRSITGVPAWLKPAKFAVSTGIYALTLAWTFTYLPAWPRVRRVAGWTTAAVFIGEVAIISLQAWRGTNSHFNVGTPLDAVLFAAMGIGIFTQTATAAVVAIALWQQPFADRVMGAALRLGLSLTVVGALTGGLMTQATSGQLDEIRAGQRVTIVGGHTVGAPDGGPGLPGTGWSTGYGDLRVAHFLGLHAFQLLPLVAFALGRRRFSAGTRERLIGTTAASYAGLVAILLWQALRAQSVIAPDALTLTVVAAWLAASVGTACLVAARPRSVERTTVMV